MGAESDSDALRDVTLVVPASPKRALPSGAGPRSRWCRLYQQSRGHEALALPVRPFVFRLRGGVPGASRAAHEVRGSPSADCAGAGPFAGYGSDPVPD